MVILAYLRPATLFALALDTVVGADAGAPAYPALTGLLLRRLCLHIGDLSHSLYLLLIRLWWQMLAPPQIVHSLLSRLCSHIADPPHSLHVLLMRLWWQMPAPPQLQDLEQSPC